MPETRTFAVCPVCDAPVQVDHDVISDLYRPVYHYHGRWRCIGVDQRIPAAQVRWSTPEDQD